MRRFVALGVAAMFACVLSATDVEAQCGGCGTVGYAPMSYGGYGYAGSGCCTTSCNPCCNTPRRGFFARRAWRRNCCTPSYCSTPVCNTGCNPGYASTCAPNCNTCCTSRPGLLPGVTRTYCSTCCNPCQNTCGQPMMYGSTMYGTSGCAGCAGGTVIMSQGVPAQGTIMQPQGQVIQQGPVNPPTPDDT